MGSFRTYMGSQCNRVHKGTVPGSTVPPYAAVPAPTKRCSCISQPKLGPVVEYGCATLRATAAMSSSRVAETLAAGVAADPLFCDLLANLHLEHMVILDKGR